MSWIVGPKEFEWAMGLKPTPRYAYTVNKIREHGELWSLDSSEGWSLAAGETGKSGFPVWPHRDFAFEHATGDWADAYPECISLQDWFEVATPTIIGSGWHLAVFFRPATPFTSIQVHPDKFAADLRGPALKRYEVPRPTV